jgi:hypothetical protein
MLNKLFKYTSLRLEFFDSLLIRASQKYALNDPFELRPSQVNNNTELSEKEFETLSDASYFDYSVASFSETNNNLLMWAHYAEQHKGIVIEFDLTKPLLEKYQSYNVLTSKLDKYGEENLVIDEDETRKRLALNVGKTQRVRYNSKRPSIDKFESILEHFLIKSEEWIYEKEHRVILPLVAAEKIIVHHDYLPRIEFTLYDSDSLEKTELNNGMYLINLRDVTDQEGNRYLRDMNEMDMYAPAEDLKYSFIESMYSEYLKDISRDQRTIFLYKISAESIKSIYFGCRADPEQKTKAIDKILSSKELSHVDIFDSIPSVDRFEIEFRPLKKT